jgi:hypothetical protein
MLEEQDSIIDNYLSSLVTKSYRNHDKSKKKIKKVNPEFEIFKYSTFNKHEDSNKEKAKKEPIKYSSSLGKKEISNKKKRLSTKFERKSNKSLNWKFIRKLTNKNRPEDVYHSCYDTNRNKKKDKYINDVSLEIIQKKLQRKIKEMKNDNTFMESYASIKTESFDNTMNNEKQQDLDRKNGGFPSAKLLIGSNHKNKNSKNNLNSQNKEVLQKLNVQSSQGKLSDDSSFIDDSKSFNKNNEEINKSINKEYMNSTKNISLKEKKYRILEQKKLVYDSFDDDEIIEEELLNVNIFYISPDDKSIIIFDYIIVLLTLYSLIFIPINLSFSICFKYNFLNYLMDCIYIIDLILSFFRPYYNFEDQLVFNNRKIIIHYLYSFFTVDLISSIPFYSIFKIFYENQNKCVINNLSVKLDNMHRLTELFKIIKLLKIISKKRNSGIKYIIKFINDYSIFENYKFIFKIFVSLIALHITTCLHIFISRNSFPNWIYNKNLIQSSFISIYCTSLYYTITTLTTVGYGDITGNTMNEFIFQIFLLIVGIMSYSWLVSNCSNMIQEKNVIRKKFNEKIKILDNIRLQYADMSKEMYIKIYRYLEYAHLNSNNNPKLLMDSLPYTLKNTLLNEMYKPIIMHLNFFKHFKNSSFVLEIVRKLLPIRAYKNDILLDQGDIIENMILVKEGRLSLEVKINIDNPVESINKLLNDDFLGINGMNKKNIDSLYKNFTHIDANNNKNCSSKDIISSSLIKDVKDKINFLHLKILEIRKSEHFGGLLLFLNKRTLLTLRVKSKKADLYFLKKIDAVEISSNYSNIWKRVNKISFHNLKQILKYMKKIIKQYCSAYGIKYQIKNIKDKKYHEHTKVKFNLNNNINYGKNYIDKKCNNKDNNCSMERKSNLKNDKKANKSDEQIIEQDSEIISNIQHNNEQTLTRSNHSNNGNHNNSFYSQNAIEKKKSKFYSIFANNSIPNLDTSEIKINKNELYLTPYSPEEVNDEIYIGENFLIESNNMSVIIKKKLSKKITKKFSNNIFSLSRNSFSIINPKKIYTFNIKQMQISNNYQLEFISKYENINKLSKNKYAYDKLFQSKIKKIIKNKYSYKNINNKKYVSVVDRNSLSISDKQFRSSVVLPDIKYKFNHKNKKHSQKEKKAIFSYFSSSLDDDDTESNYDSFNINNKVNTNEKKRGEFMINTSNTQVDKFNNKKYMKTRIKKNSLLNEISNNINVINHANEFYNGLLNNILKDRDKDYNLNENNNKKKKERFSGSTQISKLQLRRSSKTYKESKIFY